MYLIYLKNPAMIAFEWPRYSAFDLVIPGINFILFHLNTILRVDLYRRMHELPNKRLHQRRINKFFQDNGIEAVRTNNFLLCWLII